MNHFNNMGLHVVTFATGINGEVSGLKTIYPYTVDDKSGNFFTGHHEAGLFLSHYMLWSHVSMSHDYAIIIECFRHMSLKENMVHQEPSYLCHFLHNGYEWEFYESRLRKLDDR